MACAVTAAQHAVPADNVALHAHSRLNGGVRPCLVVALYRFELRSSVSAEAVKLRIRGLIRERPGMGQSLREAFGARPQDLPPFIGKLEGNTFNLQRDITYRNSFLPRIQGSIAPAAVGTTVVVSMSLHPLVILFMVLWLAGVGRVALGLLSSDGFGQALPSVAMFVLGVAVPLGGFYAEAEKARRILTEATKD